jgi:TonB family protein
MRRVETMPVLRRQLSWVVFAVLTLFAAAPSALPQDSPLDTAAEKIADAVSQAKIQDVIVFDFSGPDRKITPLGQKLAGEFRAALGKSAAKLHVEDRSQIPGALQAKSYPLDFVDWGELTHAFAQDIHVESFVMGELSVQADQLNVVISSYRSDTGKNITSIQIAWPISGDDKSMMTENLARITLPDDLAQYPNSGAKGYGTPACLYCPRAEYPPEPLGKKIVGTVELVGIVGDDGQFSDIRVLKPLPYGLSAAAVKAVSSWRLRPAMGPDGKPAAVRQLVEVTFQLY